MKYRTLGRTGLRVSEIGFGASAISGKTYGPTQDRESLEALETAWERGVNFFDTADSYGEGHSEELIGSFLKGKRGEAVIATKVGWDFYHPGVSKNFDPDHIRFACDQSLKRLATDWIDVYQLHNPTLEQIEEGSIFNVLEELKKAGKIRFVGVSVHVPRDAAAVIRSGKADAMQLIFNLIDQRQAEAVFPEAEKNGIGIIAREPLGSGFLTGKYTAETRFSKNDHRSGWAKEKKESDLRKISILKSQLNASRLSMVQAALEFVLSFEEVSVVIPGIKTKAQVLENVKASEEPALRIEEIDHLRRTYQTEEIFRTGFFRN